MPGSGSGSQPIQLVHCDEVDLLVTYQPHQLIQSHARELRAGDDILKLGDNLPALAGANPAQIIKLLAYRLFFRTHSGVEGDSHTVTVSALV